MFDLKEDVNLTEMYSKRDAPQTNRRQFAASAGSRINIASEEQQTSLPLLYFPRNGRSKMPHTMIDLFAGAGGLSEGLREAGFEALYANEIVPRYAETYRLNHPDTVVESSDIRDVAADEVRSMMNLAKGELHLPKKSGHYLFNFGACSC